jgi:hypothetical protein
VPKRGVLGGFCLTILIGIGTGSAQAGMVCVREGSTIANGNDTGSWEDIVEKAGRMDSLNCTVRRVCWILDCEGRLVPDTELVAQARLDVVGLSCFHAGFACRSCSEACGLRPRPWWGKVCVYCIVTVGKVERSGSEET